VLHTSVGGRRRLGIRRVRRRRVVLVHHSVQVHARSLFVEEVKNPPVRVWCAKTGKSKLPIVM
jgi:hypothetical protein